MVKPSTADGYDNEVTRNCERVLVTLIRGLGPWRDSIYLVGGLTPRYLIDKRPPEVPVHAGTGDVDVVIQLHMLANNDAYHTLEDNFKKMKFTRGTNGKGTPVSWRWVVEAAPGMNVTLELLADDPKKSGGKVMELVPESGNVSALNIPHSGIVFDHHRSRTITAETLGENGITEVTLRYADLVAFTCLKAYAIDQRDERKDAHDLIYCLTYYEGGLQAAAAEFRAALEGKHKQVVADALAILARHFVDDGTTEGYLKIGPVGAAKFEMGEDNETRESRILRQREVADLVDRFLKAIKG
jgi:hypothetical protein